MSPATGVHGLFVTFGLVVAAFFPFLAIYLAGRGLSAAEIGVVIATMAVVRIVVNPFWGHVADTKIGRLRALQLGAAGAAAGAISANLVQGVPAIAASASVVAAFMVSTGANIDAIALVHLGGERMSDYGRIRAWESLSYASGCLVFGTILEAAGVHLAMPIYAIASLLVLAWSTSIARDRPAPLASHGRLGSVGAVFREAPRFWGFLAAVVLLWTGFNAAWNFIALKISSEGGGPLLIGIGTALGGLVEVPMMRFSSRVQRRWGLRRVYVTGCCIYALGFLLWGLIDSPTVVSFLTVFEGAGFALLFTTTVVVIGRLLPSTLYSTGNAVAQMVGFGISPIIGAGAGGFVYEHLGPVVLYTCASSLTLLAAGVAWIALSTPALAVPEGVAATTPQMVAPEPPPAPGEVVP